MILVLLALTGCAGDAAQRQLCESLLPAFEPYPDTVEILSVSVDPTDDHQLTIMYRARDRTGWVRKHWLVCGFRGSAFLGDRLTLTKVVNDRQGVFNATQLQMLRIWQRLMAHQPPPVISAEPEPPGAPLDSPLYLLQQFVNAIVPCAVYMLLAVGFNLVYGLIGRINFAFGDIATVAGLTLFLGLALAATGTLADPGWTWWALAMAAAVATAAVWGLASERFVFRPLAGADGQAALIAAIGLAIAMREGLRLAQGSRDFWLPPIVTRTWVLARSAQTAVSVSGQQLALLAAAVTTCTTIVLLLRCSRFGRHYRACCEDRRMAALVGVNVTRTAAVSFAIAGAASGLAGLFVTVYYGTADAYMGLMLGFKALVAAVAGGLGSIGGALLGGLLVGLIEQLWSAYLTFGYRDIALFGLLVTVLVFRPHGLLGRLADRRAGP